MAKDVTEEISRPCIPQAALIVYSTENSYNYQTSYYLETRLVKQDGTLGAARPVSKKFIQELVQAFKADYEKRPHGLMPQNFLVADSRIGQEKYIWWTPPGKKNLYFSESIGVQDGEYNMPGCIFAVLGERLHVFAFEGNEPKQKGELLYGPFFNYYADCGICLGSAKVKWPDDITWKDIQTHWETLFWNSVNSHSITNPVKKGQNLVLTIKESKDAPYKTSKLQRTEYTLETFLQKYGK